MARFGVNLVYLHAGVGVLWHPALLAPWGSWAVFSVCDGEVSPSEDCSAAGLISTGLQLLQGEM